jgi:hypothetical protein
MAVVEDTPRRAKKVRNFSSDRLTRFCLMARSTTTDRKDRLTQIAAIATFWIVYLGLAAGGEYTLQALGGHFGWTDRARFVTQIGFWWFLILVTVTILNVAVQWATAKRQQRIAAGTMVLMAVWSFFRLRGSTATAVGPAIGRDVNLLCLMILAILNLRADVWVAKAYGVTVAEAHNLQPIWIIPVLTLALVAWSALVFTFTKPKRKVSTADKRADRAVQ